jgi:hypothetical protein
MDCNTCALNVSIYVPPEDIKEAVMLRSSAGVAVDTRLAYEHNRDMGNLVKVIVWILIIVGVVLWWNLRPQKPPPKDTVQAGAFAIEAEIRRDGTTPDVMVTAAKRFIRDVDHNYVIDCIEYAVMFATIFPSAKIIWNYNPSTDMNHLLNQWDGMYIEPQASEGKWKPEDVWGARYDPKYNQDATYKWAPYKIPLDRM